MQEEYIVVHKYESSNINPIELKAGDVVEIGEKSKDDGSWANWIYCVSIRTKRAGWTPVQILEIAGEKGVATTDYTAKEMTVAVGDVVQGHNELNGWLWCTRKSDGESGWVPQNCIKLLT